jgi:radical SAM superfamily enzyme YgiQ (UPF0313 family)
MLTQETLLYTPVSARPGAVRMAFAYPADTTVALSSLGYLILFKELDTHPDVDVFRLNTDNMAQFRGEPIDVLGVSFSFELDILNVFKIFDALGIPYYAKDRGPEHPLIFAGGPVPTTNPEPYAPFFDAFLIGDGESLITQTVLTLGQRDVPREQRLRTAAKTLSGVYVPSLYDVTYQDPEGPIAAITALDGAPMPVGRHTTPDLLVAASPILSPQAVYSNTYLVEVVRGCAHRCRFCMASYSTLPTRAAELSPILSAVQAGLQHTDKLGLLGALVSEHPDFPELCDWLNAEMDRGRPLQLSCGSLRADNITPQIAQTFQRGQQRKLTIAVESGSESLRRRINKNLKEATVLQAADTLAAAGMKGLKVYGMVGLPDETDADVEALVTLMKALRKVAPRLELTLGCSTFVPKAATPFQWIGRMPVKVLEKRQEMLRKGLLKTAQFRPSSPKWDAFQAWLSRGDRRLAPVLVAFAQLGGSLGALNRAYKQVQEAGIRLPEVDWYALRARPPEEVLPWEMIQLGVSKEILYKESQAPPGFQASA